MATQAQPNPSLQNPSRNNIEAIAQLERGALDRRSPTERFSEYPVKYLCSIAFLLLNAALMAAWTVINLNLIPGLTPFDRFPFGILALIVAAESILLTVFALISQNRLKRQSDRRARLDLQVGLLAEQEWTALV
jgi:uncharacterized membrane protein